MDKKLKTNHKNMNKECCIQEPQTLTKTKTSVKVGLAIAGGIVLAMAMAGGVYIKQNANYVRYSDNLPETILTSDTAIPINVEGTIKSLFLSGKIKLNGENSLIRAILTDSGNKEYLVYETYPLIARKTSFSVDRACDETCILPDIKPKELKIQVINAEFDISNTVYYTREQPGGIFKDKRTPEQARQDSVKKKIDALNKEIKTEGMNWVAGETSVSGLTYEQKKHLFHSPDGVMVKEVPNLQGFEYYKGGVFEYRTDDSFENKAKPPANGALIKNILDQFEKLNFIPGAKSALAAIINDSDLPEKWDWRNVHGENWMTQVKDQSPAGTCWAFSEVGALEAQINVFYNKHLNIDLSEQMVVDSFYNGEIPELCGIFLPNQFNGFCSKVKETGIVDELCDKYVGRLDDPNACNYNNICSDWKSRRWKYQNFNEYLIGPEGQTFNVGCDNRQVITSEDELKRILITKGPVSSGFMGAYHAMVLVGYINANVSVPNLMILPWYTAPNSATVWIFKNSWGTDWGEKGYGQIRVKFSDLVTVEIPSGPFIPPEGETYQINCVDKDDDGYCNWGISENKPSTCPASCKPEKDYDDFNPNINIKLPPKNTSTITVLSPNGGEKWEQGKTYKVIWRSNGVRTADMTLENGPYSLSINGFLTNSSSGSGSANFQVPKDFPLGDAQLYVRDKDNSDVFGMPDSAVKIIAPPSITILSPNGGEKWAPGSTQTITWKSSNVAQVGLDLTLIDGTPVVMNLVNVQGNPGTATWTIPKHIQPKKYLLRISGCSGSHSAGNCAVQSIISDVSDAPFNIGLQQEIYYKYNYYNTYPYIPYLAGKVKKCSCDTAANSFDCVTGAPANTCNKNRGTQYNQCAFESPDSAKGIGSYCYDQSGKNYFIFRASQMGTRLK